jgi:protein-S-isoprenylcysteine O-methyltransferase Ste14
MTDSAADFAAGFFAPWVIYAVILGLHLLLPARNVEGYVTDPATGRPLRYRLNGPLVLAALVVLWVILGVTGVFAWDWLWTHRWSGLIGSAVLGVVFSVAMVLPAPRTGRSLPADLYFGRWDNPQFFGSRGGRSGRRVDVKMLLYLVGAAMLALNLLSFTAHHILVFGSAASPGVGLYCALFFWFVIDYLVFERVHLYTYDIFAERIGFKLGWGCFTFYPYFYAVGLWAVADRPDPGTPSGLLVLYAVVFFVGWSLSRGANMQKYTFKRDPHRVFLGVMEPKVLTDGKNALLAGGFWGVSRHVNYLGEILMAVGLTLCLGYPGYWLVWLYPLYYVVLLFPRERADERRCAAKYGDLWTEYERRVPKRIIPWVY